MSPSHFKVKSLSGNIFSSVLVFALALIMVFGVVMTSIYYYSYEHDAEAKLSALASDAAKSLNETSSEANIPVLREQFAGMVRYTLIANDGTVLFDSVADEGSLGDHHERPEVLEADATGASTVVRYSETLKTDTVYAAVKLSDGSIIRLAETRESLAAFLGSMIAPLAAALVLVSVAVFFLSKTLTRRIMKPIDALNFADPLENEIYEEMDPLLERIDEQQKLLKQQNEELALAENMRRDFSSNVSHEMKTPLQVISGYAELMKNDMVQPSDRQKFAALIYEEAQAMRSLINDVLTLSRLRRVVLRCRARNGNRSARHGGSCGEPLGQLRRRTRRAGKRNRRQRAHFRQRDVGRGNAVQPYRERHSLQPRRRQRNHGRGG